MLILTRDSVLDALGDVTVAPITSTVRSIASEVLLTEECQVATAFPIETRTVPIAKLDSGTLVAQLVKDLLEAMSQAHTLPSKLAQLRSQQASLLDHLRARNLLR